MFPSEASELLPVYNKTVSMKYVQSIPVGDWSDPSQTVGLHGAVHQFPGTGSHGNSHRNYSTRTKTVINTKIDSERVGSKRNSESSSSSEASPLEPGGNHVQSL